MKRQKEKGRKGERHTNTKAARFCLNRRVPDSMS